MFWNKPRYQLQALLALAFFWGGGGSAYGVNNLMVQLAALLLLATYLGGLLDVLRNGPRLFAVLCVATLALPLVQLIPLPASVWSQLPGRNLLSESLELIGRPGIWYPISLAPSRTLLAFFSMIPMVVVIMLSWRFNLIAWERVIWTIVLLALAMVFLGGIQLLSENNIFLLYREHVRPDYLYVTFANHNTAGLFFVLALVCLMYPFHGIAKGDGGQVAWWSQRWVRMSFAMIMIIAVVLTQSRSSILVLLMVLGAAAFKYFYCMRASRLHKLAILVFCILIGAGAMIGLQAGTRFGESLDRFERLEDMRPAIWEDTLSSTLRFWPVGSGISTFPEVFEVDETLEHVWARRAGRAHNDFLEIIQEGGLVGGLLVFAWIVWLVWFAARAWQGEKRWHGFAAVVGILAIMLQSAVDYPLRNQAILCFAAVFVSLLMHSARGASLREQKGCK